jgi:CO dehydrogenase/acetyl-CoA synthase alpha subunit
MKTRRTLAVVSLVAIATTAAFAADAAKGKRVMPMNDDFRAPVQRMAAAGSSPTCCPTDLNCDGVIDGADLSTLLSSWGPCPPKGSCDADFNGNGSVDGADLSTLLATWGPCVG